MSTGLSPLPAPAEESRGFDHVVYTNPLAQSPQPGDDDAWCYRTPDSNLKTAAGRRPNAKPSAESSDSDDDQAHRQPLERLMPTEPSSQLHRSGAWASSSGHTPRSAFNASISLRRSRELAPATAAGALLPGPVQPAPTAMSSAQKPSEKDAQVLAAWQRSLRQATSPGSAGPRTGASTRSSSSAKTPGSSGSKPESARKKLYDSYSLRTSRKGSLAAAAGAGSPGPPVQGGSTPQARSAGTAANTDDSTALARSDQFSLRKSRQQKMPEQAVEQAAGMAAGAAEAAANTPSKLPGSPSTRRAQQQQQQPGSAAKASTPGSSMRKARLRPINTAAPDAAVSQYDWDPSLDPSQLTTKKDKLPRTPPGGKAGAPPSMFSSRASSGSGADTKAGRDAGGNQGPKLQRPHDLSMHRRTWRSHEKRYYDSQPHQDMLGPPPDCRCCVVQ